MKLSSFLRTSPSPITSQFMLFSFSSSSSSCTYSSFSNVLTFYVAIFNRSLLVWWSFLTQRFLAPRVCILGGPEPPPRSQTSMLLGTGGLGLFVLCMLVFTAYTSTLANAGWKEVPTLEYQARGVKFGAPSLGICVPSTEELYLPCYLAQLLASLCSIGWFGI